MLFPTSKSTCLIRNYFQIHIHRAVLDLGREGSAEGAFVVPPAAIFSRLLHAWGLGHARTRRTVRRSLPVVSTRGGREPGLCSFVRLQISGAVQATSASVPGRTE